MNTNDNTNRRHCIHDEDGVMYPQEKPSPEWVRDLAMSAPLLVLLIVGYIYMAVDIIF